MIASPDAPPITFQNGTTKLWSIYVRIMTLVLGGIVIPWCVWMTASHFAVHTRISVMEGNSFTSKDGMELERQWDAEYTVLRADIGRVLERLASIEAKLPAGGIK